VTAPGHRTTGASAGTTNDTPESDVDRTRLIRRLEELIASLDSRVPHRERDGEIQIARDAEALRDIAQRRLEQLKT
jgi:hypothetical protein